MTEGIRITIPLTHVPICGRVFVSGETMKAILTEIVNRLADTAASVDAMELALVESGVLKRDTIHNRFQTHKNTVESHLVLLRQQISALSE